MTIFTYSQARQNLAKLLNLARKTIKKSPLDVKDIKSKLTADEIVKAVRESRQRHT